MAGIGLGRQTFLLEVSPDRFLDQLLLGNVPLRSFNFHFPVERFRNAGLNGDPTFQ